MSQLQILEAVEVTDASPALGRSLKDECWSKCDAFFDVQQFVCGFTFLLFVSAVIVVFIVVQVYLKPVGINIVVQSVNVNNFTIIKRVEESDQGYFAVYIVAYVDFVFLATNPSSRFTVVYGNTSFECLTRTLHLGLLRTGSFRQRPLSSTNWTRVLLLDAPVPVPGPLRAAVIQDAFSMGLVSLHVAGSVVSHFEIGGFSFPSFEEVLNCSVKFTYSDSSVTGINC